MNIHMYGNYGDRQRGDREERGGYGGGGGFRSRGFGDGGFTAPVKVGEELEVTIEAVGEKGDGIAKKNGFVLFIPGVKQGQTVRIRVTKVLRKVGFAEVVNGSPVAAPEQTDEPYQESSDTENF